MVERIGTKKPREVVRALLALGGEVLHVQGKMAGKGSHTAIRMPGVSRPVIVPDTEHSRQMLRTIARQARSDWETFVRQFSE